MRWAEERLVFRLKHLKPHKHLSSIVRVVRALFLTLRWEESYTKQPQSKKIAFFELSHCSKDNYRSVMKATAVHFQLRSCLVQPTILLMTRWLTHVRLWHHSRREVCRSGGRWLRACSEFWTLNGIRCGGESSSANQHFRYFGSASPIKIDRWNAMHKTIASKKVTVATASSIIGGKIPNLPLVFLPAGKPAGLAILV